MTEMYFSSRKITVWSTTSNEFVVERLQNPVYFLEIFVLEWTENNKILGVLKLHSNKPLSNILLRAILSKNSRPLGSACSGCLLL
jgi:hypothetical protein